MSTVFRILLLIGLFGLCRGHRSGEKAHACCHHLHGLFHHHVRGVAAAGISGSGHHRGRRGRRHHGILFFLTLRRINLIDKDAEHEARREEDHHDDTL